MGSTAISVENLLFSYDSRPPLLRDISFKVTEGELIAIVGASGSGKTTLCRILSGIIPHAVKGSVEGNITVMDINPLSAGLPKTSHKVGMVFQDSDSQIICTTVEDEIAFSLENLCVSPVQINIRVNELLSEFGLENERLANPNQLSGGKKKLLTIASVLASSPPILILDEPLESLDDENANLVLKTIDALRQQRRTIIVVEHDLRSVMTADKWLLLSEGTMAAYGKPCEIMHDEEKLRNLGVWP